MSEHYERGPGSQLAAEGGPFGQRREPMSTFASHCSCFGGVAPRFGGFPCQPSLVICTRSGGVACDRVANSRLQSRSFLVNTLSREEVSHLVEEVNSECSGLCFVMCCRVKCLNSYILYM